MPGAIGRNSARDRQSIDLGVEAADVLAACNDWLHPVGWR